MIIVTPSTQCQLEFRRNHANQLVLIRLMTNLPAAEVILRGYLFFASPFMDSNPLATMQ